MKREPVEETVYGMERECRINLVQRNIVSNRINFFVNAGQGVF